MTLMIVSHATYDSNTLRPVIFGMMEAMGGAKIGSCIRCCCLEICPFGALRTTETRARRIVRSAIAVILPPGTTR